jgi:16S rRNA (uracil1498-N3)-methyltransferase
MRRVYIETLNEQKHSYTIFRKNREFNHLKNVLRVAPNDVLEGFNLKGLVSKIIVESVEKDKITLKALDFVKVHSNNSRINLAVSIVKPKYFNFILKSAVQIGIKNILPFVSEYSYIKNFSTEKLIKWNNVIVEGAKQSGNNRFDFIKKIYNLEEIANVSSNNKYFFDLYGETVYNIKSYMNPADDVYLVIGAEAGFSDNEREFLKDSGFKSIKMNFNILRTEVATVAMLSILKYLTGEA